VEDEFNPQPLAPRPLRERTIEQAHVQSVVAAGGRSLKFVSPGHNGVPDRIDLYGVKRMIEAAQKVGIELDVPQAVLLLGAAIQFTECKRPGERPNATQEREHDRLRAAGFIVNVVDSK
jgi:hypothetical protein